jgi:hypothetical protein
VGESRCSIKRIELRTFRSFFGHKIQEANIIACTATSMKKDSNGGLSVTPRSANLLKVIFDR